VISVHVLPMSSPGWVPAELHSAVCAANGGVYTQESHLAQFDAEPWRAFYFKPSAPFRYRYTWLLAQQADATNGALGYAQALGDLNCNGVYSTWRITVREDRVGGDSIMRTIGPFIFQGPETE